VKGWRRPRGSAARNQAGELADRVHEAGPEGRPPPFERLVGDLKGAYSRRINIQHRLVYEVIDAEKIVKVLRLWSHYE